MSTFWDDHPDLSDRLIVLWDKGLSLGEIAKGLGHGISRSAVCGRADRLKKAGKIRARVQPHRSPRPRRESPPVMPVEPKPIPAVNDDDFQAFVLETGLFVTVETAKPIHCRWPFGEPSSPKFHYCGHPATSGSWCEVHKKRVFQPSSKDKTTEEAA